MNEKRAVVALFGLTVAAVVAYAAFRFIAAFTIAVFVYYSTRPLYRSLGRLRFPFVDFRTDGTIPKPYIDSKTHLPRRVRAALVLALFAVPLLLLIGYTVALLVTEARIFVEEYDLVEATVEEVGWFEGLDELPDLTFEGIVQAYQEGQFDGVIEFAAENAAILTSAVTGFFLNLLIVVILTYYFLIDGRRAREWLLRFDDEAIAREYFEAVDRELEKVLFGNLLNVIAIAVVAVIVFTVYNALVPADARVPFPALAGALTGIASLIPVVGMKIVYVPLALAVAVPAIITSELDLLGYVVVFLAVTVVLVDTIPDLLLRPYLSGDKTHVGLLMLAYILGPVVFGFHGLFLAPILLVLLLTFAETALPRLLGADEPYRRKHVDMSDAPPKVPRRPPQTLPREQRDLGEYRGTEYDRSD